MNFEDHKQLKMEFNTALESLKTDTDLQDTVEEFVQYLKKFELGIKKTQFQSMGQN